CLHDSAISGNAEGGATVNLVRTNRRSRSRYRRRATPPPRPLSTFDKTPLNGLAILRSIEKRITSGVVLNVEIALIQHARPERWEGDGPADPQLTLQGISQAQRLVDHLTGPSAPTFHGLYCSTMTRAVETASPLA